MLLIKKQTQLDQLTCFFLCFACPSIHLKSCLIMYFFTCAHHYLPAHRVLLCLTEEHSSSNQPQTQLSSPLAGVWHHHRHNIILTIFCGGKNEPLSHIACLTDQAPVSFHPYPPFFLVFSTCFLSLCLSVTLSLPPAHPSLFQPMLLPFPPSPLVTYLHHLHSSRLYIAAPR